MRLFAASLAFGCALALSPAPAQEAGQAPAEASKVEGMIVRLTNEFRKKQGLDPVQPSKELQQAATYFAGFMAMTDKYGHSADETQPADRAKKFGYEYCLVSENIAYLLDPRGIETEALAAKLTQGWIDSPGHRKNMVDPGVTDLAVAVARSEETGKYFAVQMFGRPASKRLQFRVANRSEVAVAYKLGEQEFQIKPMVIRTHQVCRPEPVTFQLPGDATKAIDATDGTHIVLTPDGAGGVKVGTAEE